MWRRRQSAAEQRTAAIAVQATVVLADAVGDSRRRSSSEGDAPANSARAASEDTLERRSTECVTTIFPSLASKSEPGSPTNKGAAAGRARSMAKDIAVAERARTLAKQRQRARTSCSPLRPSTASSRT